ncbi:ABC transporter ATP-binding protein [Flavivirga spongiicola]|uniref:ABC transporter ATP-binding protein n=1 Tax=Flavivirga spongiicola TaxID=421621 RepID=A0ABU7XMM9_9FLAO|nr:ABC transporter ATP-binding protein [Flavivirga sp. MEBiC05379]MDO5981655.1 ABC transporter ATP-binding protein [Flavivirga sp. MEBiC05379]
MKDETILKVENVSKQYRLGLVGTGTISHDLNRWWYSIRGKEDPYLKVGDINDRSAKAKSDYVWAIRNIDFEVKKGEVLGIIGKNGAGKSTLLKILAKVTSPTLGEIKTKGRIASLLEVGTGFHGEMTGRENIFLNGAILGMTKKEIKSKIDEIIEFSGCQRYIDTPVKRYSSGMTVRLAFAVAAFLEPEILVIDEVLAVGDVEFQKKAVGKMQDISNEEGRTVLFVSHNMAAVKSLCSRCIILDKGEVSFCGNTDEAIDKYVKSNSDNSYIKVSEKQEREGNGSLRFTNIIFNDGEGVFIGSSLKISLKYEAKDVIESLDLAVTICAGYEERILTIDNVFQGEKLKIVKKKGTIEIIVPKTYLLSGTYSVNIWAAKEGAVLDYLINAASLYIENIDIYGTGKVLSAKKHGVVFSEKSQWKVV